MLNNETLRRILVNYLLISKSIVPDDLKFLFKNCGAKQVSIDKFLLTLPPEFKTDGYSIILSHPLNKQHLSPHLQYKILNFAQYIDRRRFVQGTNFTWETIDNKLSCRLSGGWTVKVNHAYDDIVLIHDDPMVMSACITDCEDLNEVELKVLRYLGPITSYDYFDPIYR